MLIYIGNSRWTNSRRSMARHIANGERLPLCGEIYRNGANDIYEGDILDCTCQRCLAIYNKESIG